MPNADPTFVCAQDPAGGGEQQLLLGREGQAVRDPRAPGTGEWRAKDPSWSSEEVEGGETIHELRPQTCGACSIVPVDCTCKIQNQRWKYSGLQDGAHRAVVFKYEVF